MKVQLIRHATLLLYVNNKKILIDPVLSQAGSMPPIQNVPNQNYNPLVELPITIDNIINCDAVLVTHTHRDHFDDASINLLPKSIPILCQPDDEIKLQSYGFTDVHPINSTYIWNDITFNRTKGKHGHGEVAIEMAPVSGFVISSNEEPVLYIAGDTVWCDEVDEALEKFKPAIIVCNCGSAQFSYGKPITMTAKDINELCRKYTTIKVIAVHMEAWNHCRLSRKDLKEYLNINAIDAFVTIPENGESISF